MKKFNYTNEEILWENFYINEEGNEVFITVVQQKRWKNIYVQVEWMNDEYTKTTQLNTKNILEKINWDFSKIKARIIPSYYGDKARVWAI